MIIQNIEDYNQIPSYSGYRIDKTGNIISYYKKIAFYGGGSKNIIVSTPQLFMKTYLDNDGYRRMQLSSDDGTRKKEPFIN